VENSTKRPQIVDFQAMLLTSAGMREISKTGWWDLENPNTLES
jgi:hypothetical protein